MAKKISRRKKKEVKELLSLFPAVLILGQRQVGKTTLAVDVAKAIKDFHYGDLSNPETLNEIRSFGVNKYVKEHGKHLTVLDEVQFHSELFRELLPIINERRLAGKGNGSFLLLGSASLELANRSKETLTGRIGYVDLDPIDIMEITGLDEIKKLWLRGGLPDPFTADNNRKAFTILDNLIRNLSRQELLEQGVQMARDKVFKLLLGLANQHSSQLNISDLTRQVGLDWDEVSNCVSRLVDLLVVRELPAYAKANVKNFEKRPRIYYRDSGLLHQLLRLPNMTRLLAVPKRAGKSWEGFAIENILRQAGPEVESSYLRTRKGKGEMDLILRFQTGEVWAIEIKKGAPDAGASFDNARDIIKPDRCFIVHGLRKPSRVPKEQAVEIISLLGICREVAKVASIL